MSPPVQSISHSSHAPKPQTSQPERRKTTDERRKRTVSQRNVLRERGLDLVEHVRVERGEVARELVAHDRDVELVVDGGAEGVS